MAVTFALFDSFFGNVGGGRIDLDTDTFKAMLTNTAPSISADDELADITQISNGNGYTTGGVTLTSVTWTEPDSNGVWKFASANFQWSASGGSIGPFRYIPIYSDTSTGDKLVGRYDFGSELTIPDGSVFEVEIGTDGIIRFGVGTLA
jgi:hypothetical protein